MEEDVQNMTDLEGENFQQRRSMSILELLHSRSHTLLQEYP